jgi:hypothetical protein
MVLVDDDGARSNGTVYVQINTTSKFSFGSIFEFNLLKFPLLEIPFTVITSWVLILKYG